MPTLQRAIGNQAALRLLNQADRDDALDARDLTGGWDENSTKVQRITDEELEEIKSNKSDLKKYNEIRKKYAGAVGFGTPLYDHVEEDFDYYRVKATDLDNLDKLLTDAIKSAREKAQAASSAPLMGGPAPQPQALVASSASSTPIPVPSSQSSSYSNPTAAATPLSTKKTGKKKSAPKNLASQFFTSAPTQQQPVDESPNPLYNAAIQALIATRPPNATSAMVFSHVSQDTVYFSLTVRVPEPNNPGYPRVLVYPLEVHYHPVPTSSNYLHVKRSASSDPGNALTPNNWLIDVAVLRQGRQNWNLNNPSTPSPHTF